MGVLTGEEVDALYDNEMLAELLRARIAQDGGLKCSFSGAPIEYPAIYWHTMDGELLVCNTGAVKDWLPSVMRDVWAAEEIAENPDDEKTRRLVKYARRPY